MQPLHPLIIHQSFLKAITHTHNRFTGLIPGLPGWAGCTRNLLDFMVQGKITEADTATIRMGANPSGLISDPPPSSPIFMPDALPATTFPIYPGLGEATNMLACISSGLVSLTLSVITKWKHIWVGTTNHTGLTRENTLKRLIKYWNCSSLDHSMLQ